MSLSSQNFIVTTLSDIQADSNTSNRKTATRTPEKEKPALDPSRFDNRQLELDAQFEWLWERYGLKTGKKMARKAFDKIKPDLDLMGMFYDSLKNYDEYILSERWLKKKHLATWLNQECWNDEYTISEDNDQ